MGNPTVQSSLLRNPRATLDALDRIDAEESLIGFIRAFWKVLEPTQKFVEGWALTAICEHLEAVSSGQIRRLLINVPPGCMKSLTTNVFWPAWEWGPRNKPSLRYVSASYSEDLTLRDNRRCRSLILSDRYQKFWGDRVQISDEQNAKGRYDTKQRGFKIATSVSGLGTGERGDRFIIDDPHNIKETESDVKRDAVLQWFTEVVPTRVNNDSSAILMIMQRVHERDCSGHVLAKELGWDHLCLPMEYEVDHPFRSRTTRAFVDPRTKDGELLWPQRFSPTSVEELKKTLSSHGGSYAVAGQLQQRPAPRGGGMFKKADFVIVDSGPTVARRVRAWDFAGSKDKRDAAFTVGLRMAISPDGRTYVEDVRRKRLSPAEVEALVLATAQHDGVNVPISLPQDPGQAGLAQKMAMSRLLAGFTFRFSPESGSKEDRALPLAAQAEAGNVYLVKAPWNDDFIDEATKFPRGEWKDQVDAASRAYADLLRRRGRNVGFFAPTLMTEGSA